MHDRIDPSDRLSDRGHAAGVGRPKPVRGCTVVLTGFGPSHGMIDDGPLTPWALGRAAMVGPRGEMQEFRSRLRITEFARHLISHRGRKEMNK